MPGGLTCFGELSAGYCSRPINGLDWRCTSTATRNVFIGASLSEPHTYAKNDDFIWLYLSYVLPYISIWCDKMATPRKWPKYLLQKASQGRLCERNAGCLLPASTLNVIWRDMGYASDFSPSSIHNQEINCETTVLEFVNICSNFQLSLMTCCLQRPLESL